MHVHARMRTHAQLDEARRYERQGTAKQDQKQEHGW
jgi:hypothetical protein